MMIEGKKELRYGLSRNGWIITAVIFIINIPRIILMPPTISQDPFTFILDIGAGFVGAYLGVRILSGAWNFIKGIVGRREGKDKVSKIGQEEKESEKEPGGG